MPTLEATRTSTKISVKNVLFATDFSEASRQALPYAMAICRHYGSTLHALHVIPEMVYPLAPRMMAPIAATPTYEAVRQEAQGELRRMAIRLGHIPNHSHIRTGSVWQAVSEIILKENIDLLIIGTHGRTGVGKLLVGSVAEEIFRQAPCPVLTVGPNVSGKARLPMLGGESLNVAPIYVEIGEILYATDFRSKTPAAAAFAVSLAQEFQSHLTLLHVIEKHEDYGTPGPVDWTLSRLSELVPDDADLWCSPEPVVKYGSPADCILQTASERSADLIVLGARPADGHMGAAIHLPWATAHRVIAHAACPVLTVRG
ncbi:MAG TPA: universal stress protein [Terriglobales bacterium]|nr:universal stress protein [Terriglobales bacterium]